MKKKETEKNTRRVFRGGKQIKHKREEMTNTKRNEILSFNIYLFNTFNMWQSSTEK